MGATPSKQGAVYRPRNAFACDDLGRGGLGAQADIRNTKSRSVFQGSAVFLCDG